MPRKSKTASKGYGKTASTAKSKKRVVRKRK